MQHPTLDANKLVPWLIDSIEKGYINSDCMGVNIVKLRPIL